MMICGVQYVRAAGSIAGLGSKWQRYQSPHFELFSDSSEKSSRELLRELELFHATTAGVVHATEGRPNVVTVNYFKNEREFFPYVELSSRKSGAVAGYYFNAADRSVIVLSPEWTHRWGGRTVFHEYVHHLIAMSDAKPALWYNEGLAELLSSIQETRGRVRFGGGIPEYSWVLSAVGLVPMDKLFAINHDSPGYTDRHGAGIFYAQSWLFLHYWYCGKLDLTPEQRTRRDRFFDYIQNETENGDPAAREKLFKECFGMNYVEMVLKLHQYARSGRYTWIEVAAPAIAPVQSYEMRPAGEEEMAERLSELDFRVNRSSAAKQALVDAVARSPRASRALEALGAVAWADKDLKGAREYWEQAVEAGTTNPRVYDQLLSFETGPLFSRFGPEERLPSETTAKLRQWVLKSIELAPRQADAYEVLAWVESTAEMPSVKNINLVQRHLNEMRQRAKTLLALGLIRVRFKDFETARAVVGQLQGEPLSEDLVRCREVLASCIERGEAQATASGSADSR
jgi:hypothetical protein